MFKNGHCLIVNVQEILKGDACKGIAIKNMNNRLNKIVGSFTFTEVRINFPVLFES